MAIVVKLPFALQDAAGFEKIRKHSSLNDGSQSLFDFTKQVTMNYQVSPLPDGAHLKNYIDTASDAVLLGGEKSFDENGLIFTNTDPSATHVDIGDEFNLLNYGTSINEVVSVWVTPGVTDTDGYYNSIVGYSFQTSDYKQWYIAQNPGETNYRVSAGSAASVFPINENEKTLISFWINNTTVKIYKNGNELSTTTITHPLNDPTAGDSSATPRLGTLNGFGAKWNGHVHTVHLWNATGLDVAAELQAEYIRGQ